MRHCIGLIPKEGPSDYGMSFPDLPGCVTAGSTLDEARGFAEEALALHLQGLAEDGVAIPAPSSLERIMADQENRDGLAVPVPVPANDRAVRIAIALPADVLERLDAHAERHGMSRSSVLAQAARRAIDAS